MYCSSLGSTIKTTIFHGGHYLFNQLLLDKVPGLHSNPLLELFKVLVDLVMPLALYLEIPLKIAQVGCV